jgi:hypothetical protein
MRGGGGVNGTPHRRRRSGTIETVKVELWAAIRAGVSILEDPETATDHRLKALSAISTAMAVYLKALETADTDKRLGELETLMQTLIREGR